MRKKLRKKLSIALSTAELNPVYSSFDVIGVIAIIKVANDSMAYAEKAATKIMSVHKNIRTVFAQDSPILGESIRLKGKALRKLGDREIY